MDCQKLVRCFGLDRGAFTMSQPHPDTKQNNWRFCRKCFSLYFNGLPDNGVCPAGGQHDGKTSSDYFLEADDTHKL